MRILIIEDDQTNASYMQNGLKECGYNVDHAKDGMEGLYMATEGKFDVIIADRMLPKIDGLTIIKTLRSSNVTTPVLVLSSLGKVEDRVEGLKSGGDDYLTKPFAFSELLARVEALGRRGSVAETEQTILKVEDLEMNLLTRTVKRGEQEISFQNREFRLLEYMMRRVGQVVTRTMLLEGVWDFHFNPQTNLIDAQISKIRQKVDKGHEKQLIQTIRGVGYKIG